MPAVIVVPAVGGLEAGTGLMGHGEPIRTEAAVILKSAIAHLSVHLVNSAHAARVVNTQHPLALPERDLLAHPTLGFLAIFRRCRAEPIRPANLRWRASGK